jgi:hypothetical protein
MRRFMLQVANMPRKKRDTPMMSCLPVLFLMLVVLDGPAEIHTLKGATLLGEIVDLTEDHKLILARGEGQTDIDLVDIYAIYFPASPAQPLNAPMAGIRLVDGSFLAGRIEGGDEEHLYFIHPSMGRLSLLIDNLSQIVFNEPRLPEAFNRYPTGKEDDVVFKRRSGLRGQDYIRGTLVRFSSKSLRFNCNLGELEFSLEDLEAITLAQWEPPSLPPGPSITAIFRKGSGVLKGVLMGVHREGVEIGTSFTKGIKLKRDAVDSLLFKGEGHVFLSDLDPVKVEEVPYIGGPEFFLYPFQKDQSVTGALLSCGERKYAKGLGLHAKATLTFPLNKAYKAFESFIGLCDEVLELPAEGSVRFEIRVDDETRFESPVMRGGDPPIKIPRIDLTDASLLTLMVDFAEGFDSGDRALFGNPVLIRADL